MELLIRSITVSLGSASLSVLLAAVLALATFGRRNLSARLQSGLASSFLLLPSYVVAGAWSAGFGSMGWWTLSQVTAAKAPLFGIASVIWIHGMASTPIAYCLLVIGLRRIRTTSNQLACIEGGIILQFTHGIWPSWSSWVVGTFLLIAALTSNDMVVSNLFQVRTLVEQCYLDMISDESTWTIQLAACCISLLMGCVGFVIIRLAWNRNEDFKYNAAMNEIAFGPNWLGVICGWATVLLVAGVPLANLTIRAGWIPKQTKTGTVERTWDFAVAMQNAIRAPYDFYEEFQWSFSLAFWSVFFACLIASFVTFFFSSRYQVGTEERVASQKNGLKNRVLRALLAVRHQEQTRSQAFAWERTDWRLLPPELLVIESCPAGRSLKFIGFPGWSLGTRRWRSARSVVLSPILFAIFFGGLALPGPLVSGLVIQFFQLPFPGLSWLNDHTLAAPIACLQFRLIPLAILALAIFERQWREQFGELWRLDAGKSFLARKLLLWRAFGKPAFLLWIVLFAVAFGDLSSFLQCLPPGVTPISMRIFDLLHYGVRSAEAGLLLFLVLLGAVLGLQIRFFRPHT